jgi:hypothetical protein
MVLALSAGAVALLCFGVAVLIIVVVLIIAPWKRVRSEPPLPEDVETRLLLGETFAQVDAETNPAASISVPPVASLGEPFDFDGTGDDAFGS